MLSTACVNDTSYLRSNFLIHHLPHGFFYRNASSSEMTICSVLLLRHLVSLHAPLTLCFLEQSCLVFSSIPWSFFAFFKDISNSRILHSESAQWYEWLFPSDIKTERLENVLINIWLGSFRIDNDKNCPPQRSDGYKKKKVNFQPAPWFHQMHKLHSKKRVTWFTVLRIGNCGLNRFIPGLWLKPGFKFKPLSWY